MMLEVPELVSVSDKLWLLPNWTLPKARPAGIAVSGPAGAPVPDTEIVTVWLLFPFAFRRRALLDVSDMSIITAMDPLAGPVTFGENVTLKVELC